MVCVVGILVWYFIIRLVYIYISIRLIRLQGILVIIIIRFIAAINTSRFKRGRG